MTDTEIIEALRGKLAVPTGRHLYGILGAYDALKRFSKKLQQAKTSDGIPFPAPLSVNAGILDAIPDSEFLDLAKNEPRRPEPTARHVEQAFERFIREKLGDKGLVVLRDLEMLFAYNVELNLLRTLAADQSRVLLLLPGKRLGNTIAMFHGLTDYSFMLPTNLIAENHLWELR